MRAPSLEPADATPRAPELNVVQDAPEDETPGKSQSWPRDAGPWPNGCISGEPTATTEPPAWPAASKSYATSRTAESVVAPVDL